MNVSSIGVSSPITRLHGSMAEKIAKGSQDVGAAVSDTVEISDAARYLGELKKLPDVREEKVAAAKQLIAAGVYETPHRLDVTISRLMEDLA